MKTRKRERKKRRRKTIIWTYDKERWNMIHHQINLILRVNTLWWNIIYFFVFFFFFFLFIYIIIHSLSNFIWLLWLRIFDRFIWLRGRYSSWSLASYATISVFIVSNRSQWSLMQWWWLYLLLYATFTNTTKTHTIRSILLMCAYASRTIDFRDAWLSVVAANRPIRRGLVVRFLILVCPHNDRCSHIHLLRCNHQWKTRIQINEQQNNEQQLAGRAFNTQLMHVWFSFVVIYVCEKNRIWSGFIFRCLKTKMNSWMLEWTQRANN